MKKILYSLLFIFTVIFTACEEDLPKASFDLYELKSLTATAGDMNVTLSWEAYENARPNEYFDSLDFRIIRCGRRRDDCGCKNNDCHYQ